MNPSVQSAVVNTPHIRVLDEWQETIPEDLYIPPAAFEILLEHFEGPLDFLIYLIQKNGFNLLHIDIAPIATQYLSYMNNMKSLDIELTADYMVMASLLADLKSRLLLPQPNKIQIEYNPQQQLIDRLEAYLQIKHAAQRLGQMPILERDTFPAHIHIMEHIQSSPVGYAAEQLRDAMLCVFQRPTLTTHHIQYEAVQLEERIQFIQAKIGHGLKLSFSDLLKPDQGRMGVVVTFMAILELTRQQKIYIIADGVDAPLEIQGVIT